VAATGQIIGQQHITRVEDPLGAVAKTDFRLPLQSDDVLPSRGDVKVLEITHRRPPKLNARGALHGGALGFGDLLVGKLQFLQVRLTIVAGINSNYLHCGSS